MQPSHSHANNTGAKAPSFKSILERIQHENNTTRTLHNHGSVLGMCSSNRLAVTQSQILEWHLNDTLTRMCMDRSNDRTIKGEMK
jgi:hypothetical protein